MLILNDLSVGYGHRTVISDINAAWAPGNIYGLLGPNGCGKTTLLKTIAGGLEPTGGKISANVFFPFDKQRGFLESMVYMPEDFRLPGYSAETFAKVYSRNRPKFSRQDFFDNLDMLEFRPNERLIIRKSKNPPKPIRKVQNPLKIGQNHNSKGLLNCKSRNIIKH